jgi:hypothetical protein
VFAYEALMRPLTPEFNNPLEILRYLRRSRNWGSWKGWSYSRRLKTQRKNTRAEGQENVYKQHPQPDDSK